MYFAVNKVARQREPDIERVAGKELLVIVFLKQQIHLQFSTWDHHFGSHNTSCSAVALRDDFDAPRY